MSQNQERRIVLVGDEIESGNQSELGSGVARVGKKIVATTSGFLQSGRGRTQVLPFQGSYDPSVGDIVIGIVKEANPGNWIIDIRAPYDAPLHVSECPWRVDFGETLEYLRPGDAILCKVMLADGQRKIQVTLKDRALGKLDEGELFEVPAVKVARVIGRSGSMRDLIKNYLECWLYIGQNGRIWIDGDPVEIQHAKHIIGFIVDNAHTSGLTDKVRAELESIRPGGIAATFEEE